MTTQWQEQLETNDSLKKVMQMNQDDDEVDRILNDHNKDTMNSIGEGDEDDKGSSTFDMRNSEKNGTTRSQSDHLQSKMAVSSSRREVD